MAYTNVWSILTPANSDASSGAAADMRKIRLDIYERLLTLGIDLEDDPLLLFDGNYYEFIPWSAFQVFSGANTWTAAVGSNYGATPGGANTYTLYAPVLLPRGATVTELAFTGQTAASSTITLTLESVDATGAVAQATLATAVQTAGISQRETTTGAISVAIDSTPANYIYYYLKLVMVAGGASTTWFQGARITYTKASLAVSK